MHTYKHEHTHTHTLKISCPIKREDRSLLKDYIFQVFPWYYENKQRDIEHNSAVKVIARPRMYFPKRCLMQGPSGRLIGQLVFVQPYSLKLGFSRSHLSTHYNGIEMYSLNVFIYEAVFISL